jgi:hypothetical protein
MGITRYDIGNTSPCVCTGSAGPCDCDGWVLGICNCNSIIDDNFDVYFNGHKLDALNLNSNSCIGGLYSTDPTIPVSLIDFSNSPPGVGPCPPAVASCCNSITPVKTLSMDWFEPCACTLSMQDTQNNGHGNYGSVRLACFKKVAGVWNLTGYILGPGTIYGTPLQGVGGVMAWGLGQTDCDCPYVNINVTGCNGAPLEGASISLDTGCTGSTNGLGVFVCPNIPNGWHTLVTTCPRFATNTDTFNYTDCPLDKDLFITMNPDGASYACVTCSTIPLKKALTLSDSVYGLCSLTWNVATGTWQGSKSVTWPGNACCPSVTFTIYYELTASCQINVWYGAPTHVPVGYRCPNGSAAKVPLGPATMTSVIVPTDCSITPAFYFEGTYPTVACPDLSGSFAFSVYPGGVTIGITE